MQRTDQKRWIMGTRIAGFVMFGMALFIPGMALANTVCCFCEGGNAPDSGVCIQATASQGISCGELPSVRGGVLACSSLPDDACLGSSEWCTTTPINYTAPPPTSGGGGSTGGGSGAGGAPGSGGVSSPSDGAEGGSGTINQGGVSSKPTIQVTPAATAPEEAAASPGSSQEIPEGYGLQNPLGSRTIPQIIGGIVQWMGGLAGSMFFLYLLWGGAQWMTARGSDEQAQNGRKKIVAATAGIIVVLTAYLLVSAVIGLVPG